MILLAALAAGAANVPLVPPIDYRLEPPKRSLRIVPRCESESDGIVVCGRRAERTRFEETAPAGALLGRDLGHGMRLSGGGPKGSVGLTLRIAF